MTLHFAEFCCVECCGMEYHELKYIFVYLFREAFLPWKKSPGKLSNFLSQRYHDLKDTFFLIKVRPKKDIGLIKGTPIHYLTYFVQVIISLKLKK
jgi:hypothetical protein